MKSTDIRWNIVGNVCKGKSWSRSIVGLVCGMNPWIHLYLHHPVCSRLPSTCTVLPAFLPAQIHSQIIRKNVTVPDCGCAGSCKEWENSQIGSCLGPYYFPYIFQEQWELLTTSFFLLGPPGNFDPGSLLSFTPQGKPEPVSTGFPSLFWSWDMNMWFICLPLKCKSGHMVTQGKVVAWPRRSEQCAEQCASLSWKCPSVA